MPHISKFLDLFLMSPKLKPVSDSCIIYFFFKENLFAKHNLLSHGFLWHSLKFHDFPDLETEIVINSLTFQVFHDL